jgi:hypothetical protein
MGINATSGFSGSIYVSVHGQAQTISDRSTVQNSGQSVSASNQSAVTVSTLARQLNDAAIRAQARDASLTRDELGKTATSLLGQICGDGYFASKTKNDAEVPDTTDPDLLARARQATDFVNGHGSNPFKSLSDDQLNLIIYDDSGNFTINERRAAWSEAYDREESWRQKVLAQAHFEYDTTGKQNNFFAACLEHYQGLPLIDQVQYPESYPAKLLHWISLDFNFRTNRADGSGEFTYVSVAVSMIEQGPYSSNNGEGTDTTSKTQVLSRPSPASDGQSIQDDASAQPADDLSVSDLLSAMAKKSERIRAALDQMGHSSAESKRDYARKRLEEIEDMLRQLMMLGLSPKQLAEIMKEVKGLIEQYQAAGKALDAGAPAAAAGTSEVAQSSGGASATGDIGAVSESAGALDASLTVPASAVGEPADVSASDALGSAQDHLASTYRSMAANLSSRGEESTADIDFMTHAKNLLTRFKAMLKHAETQQTSPGV